MNVIDDIPDGRSWVAALRARYERTVRGLAMFDGDLRQRQALIEASGLFGTPHPSPRGKIWALVELERLRQLPAR